MSVLTVRRFFDEARMIPPQSSTHQRMKCVLVLDMCVEHMLYHLIIKHGTSDQKGEVSKPQPPGFHKLWNIADQVARACGLTSGLPNKPELKTLHDIRNLVQHTSTIPSAEQVALALEPVRQFLAAVSTGAFGTDFERLRLWSEFEVLPVRNWLDDCQEALDSGVPLATIVGSKLAFDEAMRHYQRRLGDPSRVGVNLSGIKRESDMGIIGAITSFKDSVENALFMTEKKLLPLTIGLPVQAHIRYLQLIRQFVANRVMSGQISGASGPKSWLSKEVASQFMDAEFILNHTAQICIAMDEAYTGVLAQFNSGQSRFGALDWFKERVASDAS